MHALYLFFARPRAMTKIQGLRKPIHGNANPCTCTIRHVMHAVHAINNGHRNFSAFRVIQERTMEGLYFPAPQTAGETLRSPA